MNSLHPHSAFTHQPFPEDLHLFPVEMQCYGMPIPESVRELLEEPLHVCIQQKDVGILHLIRSFGREHRMPEFEIERACDLASGLSDIVILLERPLDGHNYSGLCAKLRGSESAGPNYTVRLEREKVYLRRHGSGRVHLSTKQ